MPVLLTKDGAELAYADRGAGSPILLVHGWAAHGGFFDDLAARLSVTHRVVTPTLRGHPQSSVGEAPLSIETLSDDLVALCEGLGLQRLTALGWSMGAMALWSAAPRLAGRLDSLIVEEMGPRLTNGDGWSFGLAGAYAEADIDATLAEIQADWPAYVARLTPRMFSAASRKAQPDLLSWTGAEMSKADPAAMAALWASMARQDFRAALKSIDTPMLVIRGGESQVHPDGALEFVALTAPRARAVAIPGAGHVPHLEAPDLFFEHVEAFARNPRRRDALREGVNP